MASDSEEDVCFPNVDGKCNCVLYPVGYLDPCPDHPEYTVLETKEKDNV